MANRKNASTEIYTVTTVFKPQPRFPLLIPEISSRVLNVLELEHWGADFARFDVVSDDNLFQFSVGHQNAVFTARSLEAWEKYGPRCEKAFDAVFSKYELKRVKEIVFRRDSLIDTGMSFSEMSELGLESVVSQPNLLLDSVDDWALTLERNKENEVVRAEIAPMSIEMARNHLKAYANVVRNHNVVWGQNLSSLLATLDTDRFTVSSVLKRREMKCGDLSQFLKDADSHSNKLITNSINRLTNQVQE